MHPVLSRATLVSARSTWTPSKKRITLRRGSDIAEGPWLEGDGRSGEERARRWRGDQSDAMVLRTINPQSIGVSFFAFSKRSHSEEAAQGSCQA